LSPVSFAGSSKVIIKITGKGAAKYKPNMENVPTL